MARPHLHGSRSDVTPLILSSLLLRIQRWGRLVTRPRARADHRPFGAKIRTLPRVVHNDPLRGPDPWGDRDSPRVAGRLPPTGQQRPRQRRCNWWTVPTGGSGSNIRPRPRSDTQPGYGSAAPVASEAAPDPFSRRDGPSGGCHRAKIGFGAARQAQGGCAGFLPAVHGGGESGATGALRRTRPATALSPDRCRVKSPVTGPASRPSSSRCSSAACTSPPPAGSAG